MDLLNDVQKRVTFGKDSLRTFSLYDQCYNTQQGESFLLSEENDPSQIVKKSLDQAVILLSLLLLLLLLLSGCHGGQDSLHLRAAGHGQGWQYCWRRHIGSGI